MKSKQAQIAIGFVCLIMSFAVTLQVRSVSKNRTLNNAEILRATELQAQLRTERERNASLYDQVLSYKDELEQFKSEAMASSGYSKALASQLERAELLAGLTTVEGSGVTVTMRDSSQPSEGYYDPRKIIHDGDILLVINELNDAGAEAISLNGERIVSTSEIRCSGSTVSVNNNRSAGPFEIMAIGDPVNLENALTMRDGVYELLTEYGLEVTIKRSSKLTINAFSGNMTFKYAKPVLKTQKEVTQ